MKKKSRSMHTFKKVIGGISIRLQWNEADALFKTLHNYITDTAYLQMPTTAEKCLIANIIEVKASLWKRALHEKPSITFKITWAQACALHHQTKMKKLVAPGVYEGTVLQTIFSNLDKMIA